MEQAFAEQVEARQLACPVCEKTIAAWVDTDPDAVILLSYCLCGMASSYPPDGVASLKTGRVPLPMKVQCDGCGDVVIFTAPHHRGLVASLSCPHCRPRTRLRVYRDQAGVHVAVSSGTTEPASSAV